MLPNDARCGSVEAYQTGGECDKLCLVKMGKKQESICMESQGHIFTFDLIFSGSPCHAPRGPAFSIEYFIYIRW